MHIVECVIKVGVNPDEVDDDANSRDYQIFAGSGGWGWILRKAPLRFGRTRGFGRR